MPEPVQGIGPAQALSELFALVGKMPLSVDTTIVPVVNVGDLAHDVTWGPKAWGSLYVPAPTGLNGALVEIALPVQTETIGLRVMLEDLWVISSIAGNIYIRESPGVAAPTHVGVVGWADVRKRGQPQLLINGKNDAAVPGTLGPIHYWQNANVRFQIPIGWILGQNPDTGLQQGLVIENQTLLASLAIVLTWREGAPR